jgi:hypothetical protein
MGFNHGWHTGRRWIACSASEAVLMIGLKCHRGREWSVIELRDGDEVTLFKGTESECRERLAELKKACEK